MQYYLCQKSENGRPYLGVGLATAILIASTICVGPQNSKGQLAYRRRSEHRISDQIALIAWQGSGNWIPILRSPGSKPAFSTIPVPDVVDPANCINLSTMHRSAHDSYEEKHGYCSPYIYGKWYAWG